MHMHGQTGVSRDHIIVIGHIPGNGIVSILFQFCFIKGDGIMVLRRSISNRFHRAEIAYHLSQAGLALEGRTPYKSISTKGQISFHLNLALMEARKLPDNPKNRAICASIVACQEALKVRQ